MARKKTPSTASPDAIIENLVRVYRNLTRDTVCSHCDGWGVRTYSDTSTWRYAQVAGCAMTKDVCDVCWGSGNAQQPWPSHRAVSSDDAATTRVAELEQQLRSLSDDLQSMSIRVKNSLVTPEQLRAWLKMQD